MTGDGGDIAGQHAIVAGAGSGIGRAVALRLADDGADVVCVDRDATGLQETIGAGPRLRALPLDLLDAPALESALAPLTPQIAVNCVGITGRTGIPGHEVAIEEFRQVVEINLIAAFALTRLVAPGMVERGYGRILHVASIAGKEGNAGMAAYSASKAGLIGLVKSQAKDYAGSGVTVNALAPAVIRTPMVDAMPEAQVAYMTERIPMGRLGSLDEAAALIRFVVSPEASFTTGFTFDLSGGRATY